jgi:hypothetical protein
MALFLIFVSFPFSTSISYSNATNTPPPTSETNSIQVALAPTLSSSTPRAADSSPMATIQPSSPTQSLVLSPSPPSNPLAPPI